MHKTGNACLTLWGIDLRVWKKENGKRINRTLNVRILIITHSFVKCACIYLSPWCTDTHASHVSRARSKYKHVMTEFSSVCKTVVVQLLLRCCRIFYSHTKTHAVLRINRTRPNEEKKNYAEYNKIINIREKREQRQKKKKKVKK